MLEQLAEVLGSEDGSAAGRLEQVEIAGAIVRGGGHWLLDLAVNDGASRRSRQLSSEDCSELAHAAALALALLLEEVAAAPAHDPGADAAPLASHTPSAEPVAQDIPPLPAEPKSAEPAAVVGVGAGVQSLIDTSTLARPALGVGLSLRASLAGWSLGAHGQWLPARRTAVNAERDVEFEQWAVGLRPCRTLLGSEWTFDACVAGEAGRVLARGLSLDRARDASSAWLALGPGLGVRWNRPGGALTLHADGLVPLLRERYVVNAAQEVHQTPAVTLRLALGVELGL